MTTKIKPGAQIISDFLASLDGNEGVDAETRQAIRDLHADGKLTKTRLLQSLALKRQKENACDRPTKD